MPALSDRGPARASVLLAETPSSRSVRQPATGQLTGSCFHCGGPGGRSLSRPAQSGGSWISGAAARSAQRLPPVWQVLPSQGVTWGLGSQEHEENME